MNLRYKIFTAILVAIVVIVAGFKFLAPKDTVRKINPKIMMAVGGDPRMLICTGPKDGLNADAAALAALEISEPLILSDKDKAVYRVSILRKAGAQSQTITFSTPKSGPPGKVKVGVYSGIQGAAAQFEEADLTFIQSDELVDSFINASIWGEEQPTFRPKNNPSNVSAVIEVMAPKAKRCVATRYDDEHIRPLLREFMQKVPSVLTKVSLEGFAPKEQEIFGKTYAPDKK